MKKIIFLFCIIITSTIVAFSQKKITFLEKQFDFGKIKQGEPVKHDFIIQNDDNSPIVIAEVKTSCGCTTPEFSREPLLPQKKDKITVGYNAASVGTFNKTIFITIEGETAYRELVIKGEVVSSSQ